MLAKSAFQHQYPLDPKKFTKKMIGGVVGAIMYSIIVGIVVSFIFDILFFGADTSLSHIAILLVVVTAIMFVFILSISGWYYKKYIADYFYDGSTEFITIKKGVFTPKEIHVQYQKIQDVYVDQDIIDRIMGLYDVHIASATVSSGLEAHIDGVNEQTAEALKNYFLNRLTKGSNSSAPLAQVASATTESGGSSAPSAHLILKEEVSNDTYPLTTRWIFANSLVNIFRGVWLMFVLLFAAYSPGKNSTRSLVDNFSFSFQGVVLTIVGIAGISIICHIIYLFLWRNSYRFKFLPDTLFFREGVISRSEKNLPYHTIQDVTVQQGITDRLFGIYNVQIQNAATAQFVVRGQKNKNGITIPGLKFEDATKVTEIVKGVMLSRGNQSSTGL